VGAPSGELELGGREVPVARVLRALLTDSLRRHEVRGVRAARPSFRLSELRERLLREHVFEDPGRLLQVLRRRGLLEEVSTGRGDRLYAIPAPEVLGRLLEGVGSDLGGLPGREPVGPTPEVPEGADEEGEIRRLDADYFLHLRELLTRREEDVVDFGRTFDVGKLLELLRDMFGEALYLDIALALLQQYALADVPLLAPSGRPTGSTGFHLALFGPPGTGKSFAIDDFIRGNPRTGVPPHGLPGRNRYCGGMTPAQFLRVGSHYRGRTFNFIVPEFNDWFKYRGMVEPLKLVMEQREVRWETTWGTVGPYTFRSYFSVNYNVRVGSAGDYWATISDPNFSALEDRMLLRFHTMSRERFRAVERSAERLELGQIDFEPSERIRDHLTLVHAIQTGHPLTRHRWKPRPVALTPTLYERLREVSEEALAQTSSPRFSPRLKGRAVRLAAASALVGYFSQPEEAAGPLPVGRAEEDLARLFYRQEIAARQGRFPGSG
jgi:hypothetical protein